jgi:hypothetical protein
MNSGWVLVGLIGLSSVGLAMSDTSALTAIDEIHAKMLIAMKKGDIAYLKGVMDKSFKVTSRHATYDRDQWVDITSKNLKEIRILDLTLQTSTIQVKGNVAVLRTKSSLKGVILAPERKGQKLTDRSVDEETWVKEGGKWKFKFDKTLSETATLNGKPFPT